ncbi:hypothetical protein [Janibacter sp. GS2]|uniref:hypothetical protein n=1 Tax=Janibacter sp. GS2 TaxID=3442646 RepID=UPI003EB88A50
MTSSDLTDRCRECRDEFWRGVGQLGAYQDPLAEVDEPALWPIGGSAYVRVMTLHSGIVATDGLSDPMPRDAPGRMPGLGLEIYLESTQLMDDDYGEARWLVAALEEAAGAVAGAADSLGDALADHGLLSLELSGAGAPTDWVSGGALGALIGVELPGRAAAFDVDAATVRVLSFTPLRPSELVAVTAEGPPGRRRVAQALAGQGWYSYADTERPAVL